MTTCPITNRLLGLRTAEEHLPTSDFSMVSVIQVRTGGTVQDDYPPTPDSAACIPCIQIHVGRRTPPPPCTPRMNIIQPGV